ncbi:MAG: ThiF family adenylyltransferase [Bacteroidales bacterium]|nr:ThiF family adenylyltransferase [Bacteroidales bacterium]MBQ9597188.1 ThiF family adenylyltransferase [Bacteroidales bacterium]
MTEFSFIPSTRAADARMMVIGCGALGNEVLKNLALLGIRHLTLVDFDRVEPDNLCKSVLFSAEDAARRRFKVDAAADALLRLNPALQIERHYGDAVYDLGLGIFARQDVVIGCVDSRWARYGINRNCMRTGVPWVDGGIGQLEGTARVFRPGENCYACNLGTEGLKELRLRLPCPGIVRRNLAAGKAATSVLSASIIAAVQVQEALKLLCPEALAEGRVRSLCGAIFHYEGEQLSGRTASFQAWDEDCPCHERWMPDGTLPVDVEQTSVEQLLALARRVSGEDEMTLLLRDDCFVDVVEDRRDGTRCEVMRPGRKVEAFLEAHPALQGAESARFYQNEWKEVSKIFPYQKLSLSSLGIPQCDFLRFRGKKKDYCYELRKPL